MATVRTLRTALPRLTTTTTARPASRTFTTSAQRADLARMQLIGRLGTVPEQTQTATGRTLVRYTIATGYGPRENRQTSWFNVTHFVGEGEEARGLQLTSLEKGTLVYVEAESQMRSYEDEETGKTRKALNLVQRNLQILSRPASQLQESAPEAAAASG